MRRALFALVLGLAGVPGACSVYRGCMARCDESTLPAGLTCEADCRQRAAAVMRDDEDHAARGEPVPSEEP